MTIAIASCILLDNERYIDCIKRSFENKIERKEKERERE